MTEYVDTHCHLASDRFRHDASQVARESVRAGVKILAVAADAASSRLSVELAERHDGVLASVGVHPNELLGLTDAGWDDIAELSCSPRVAAIGETGLDYYWKDTPQDLQKEWFERHIRLAMTSGKVLSVHARNSVPDVLEMLEPHLGRGLRAIWHCFVAGKKDIGPALEFAAAKGLYLAVGGLVTFEDQKPLRRHAAAIPDELLLLETDAPYLSPRPEKAERNVPTGVIRVAEVLAELRGVTAEDIARTTTRNAKNLLGEFS